MAFPTNPEARLTRSELFHEISKIRWEKDRTGREREPSRDVGEGIYTFVTHVFSDAKKGAVGLIQVGNPELASGVGH